MAARKRIVTEEVKKMDPKAKRLWVQALRSGKYIQICGAMRGTCQVIDMSSSGVERQKEVPDMTYKNMCVMGVLADVALENSGLKYSMENWNKFAYGDIPTDRTLKWAGMDEDVMDQFMSENDSKLKTFEDFADEIEERL